MAKPETIERFKITCETDVQNLGPVMLALAKIEGLSVTGNELVTEVRTFKQKQSHAVRAEDFLVDWIADHPTFQAREAIKHFRDAGRTDGAGYTALRVLVQRKLLRKLGEGRYTTTAARHQPKQAKPVHRDVDHHTFILRAASRNHGRFSTSWMKKQFEKDGRVPGNVSPTIAALMKKKAVKRVGDSEYVLLARPAKVKKPVTKKKVNGRDPDVAAAQEILHG
jgi:hypothetical protein